jgi:RNA recognition motif-containing protein
MREVRVPASKITDGSLTLFCTNFNEDVDRGVLWQIFAKFGLVGEVFIPNKLNKWGRRFGFVKFKDVEDPVALEGRLADVWCGDRKLKVNLSRFKRDSEVVPEVRKGGLKAVVSSTLVNNEVSFKQMLIPTQGKEVCEGVLCRFPTLPKGG